MKQAKATVSEAPIRVRTKPAIPKFTAPTMSMQEKRDKLKTEKLKQTEAAALAGQESTLPPETILEDEEEEQDDETTKY